MKRHDILTLHFSSTKAFIFLIRFINHFKLISLRLFKIINILIKILFFHKLQQIINIIISPNTHLLILLFFLNYLQLIFIKLSILLDFFINSIMNVVNEQTIRFLLILYFHNYILIFLIFIKNLRMKHLRSYHFISIIISFHNYHSLIILINEIINYFTPIIISHFFTIQTFSRNYSTFLINSNHHTLLFSIF